MTESAVKKVTLENNIKVIQPTRIREEYQSIIDLNPDIIITCAYGQFLPKEILDYPKYGCINVHASLLPKLRGGAPIHKAIIDGYTTTGITIMYMGLKMDNGDIISQKSIEMEKTGIVQNEEEVTFAYNISREDGEIVKLYKDGIGIKVSDGEIILKTIKPSGKKKMSVKDYFNGFKEKNNLMGKVFR